MRDFAPEHQRREVLDWFHLMENLHKIGGSNQRLNQAKTLLWQGKVDDAIAVFAECQLKQALNFCAYLEKHRHRIINYQYYQAEQICSIGSGAIESTVKQIDVEPKSLAHNGNSIMFLKSWLNARAYLNGLIFAR